MSNLLFFLVFVFIWVHAISSSLEETFL